MFKLVLTKLVNSRIESNKENFTDEEMKIIKENESVTKKMYSLGVLDGLNILAKEE